ncbi:MAG: M20/M25/M40 family metallo-hydrolase [Bdellovibrionales bacterium]|nr:M20/M25/M40 family metallo-hydrolase [Bdellovibrionales bacterium]
MKKFLLSFTLIFSSLVYALPVTVTLENEQAVVVPASELGTLAENHHHKSTYCGGFVSSFVGEVFTTPAQQKTAAFLNYSINRKNLVNKLLVQVSEPRLLSNIVWFSSYPTRYYLSASGIQAMKDLASRWQGMVKHLSFAKVELFKHKNFKQPSVVVTLQGVTDDVIIVGGHGDSINTDSDKTDAISPGADDNASGISVVTEVLQILVKNDYRPQNTIKFMAYAAEEVGLLGSMDISGQYADKAVNVIGVIQFDGTNFKGSKDLTMALIKDGTNQEQNSFLGNLIDTYLQVPWRYDSCGYACSDSYSWTYRGYPASFPAESRVKEENTRIHTANDTLAVSQNNAIHAVNFAKLGLAYVIELDK